MSGVQIKKEILENDWSLLLTESSTHLSQFFVHHIATSCKASTSSIAREQNTQELRLMVEFIVNASLMHNIQALMEVHLSASQTTFLAVDLGRCLPISAWKGFWARIGLTSRTPHHTIEQAERNIRWYSWKTGGSEHHWIPHNPFVAGEHQERDHLHWFHNTFDEAPIELDPSQVEKGLGKGLSLGEHHDGHKKGRRQHC